MTGTKTETANLLVVKYLKKYQTCSKCGGTGVVDYQTCPCLLQLRKITLGLEAGVPCSKLKLLVEQTEIDKEVEEYNFKTDKFYSRTKMLCKHLLTPYVSNLQEMQMASRSFLFLGVNDTGKTMALSWLISEIVSRGYSGLFTSFEDFSWSLWHSYDDETNKTKSDRAFTVDFLAIDELGKQRTKEGVISVLERIMKEREERMKPTFIATNKSVKEFKMSYGASIFALLKENWTILGFSPKINYRLENRKV